MREGIDSRPGTGAQDFRRCARPLGTSNGRPETVSLHRDGRGFRGGRCARVTGAPDIPSAGAIRCRSHDGGARRGRVGSGRASRSEEHTSELQSLTNLVCRLLLEKKKKKMTYDTRLL